MKKSLLIVFMSLSATFVALSPLQAGSSSSDKVAIELSSAMEKFYGKGIGDVNAFLAKEYGVTQPLQKDGGSYTYIVPVEDPFCGSVALETEGKQVLSWQTMAWKRSEENLFGTACDKAFKGK